MTTSVPKLASSAAIILLVLTACSDPAPSGTALPSPSVSGVTATTTPSTTPSARPTQPSPSATRAGEPNDLARNSLQRSLSASPLTANVTYSSSLPIKDWRPQVVKPLRVQVTAVNKRQSQKIYLSRVTASVTAYDESGVVDGPRALGDTANISPGYYVTFPTEYNQTLLLPAVDSGSIRLTVDFTYEFVALVSGDSKTSSQRDFAKQTATDRISVPLAG